MFPLIPILVTGIFFAAAHITLAWHVALAEGALEPALVFIALAVINITSMEIIVLDEYGGVQDARQDLQPPVR